VCVFVCCVKTAEPIEMPLEGRLAWAQNIWDAHERHLANTIE